MPEAALTAPLEPRTRILIVLISLAALGFVINTVRTRRLREEYALLWIASAVLLVLAPISVDLLDTVSRWAGVAYPPAFLFLIALICVLGILFQYSLSISKFANQIKVLTQELAITRARLQELEERLATWEAQS
ncbi:MAG: DUF2304 domain-containing protein [Ardenticatenaceae bacterium]|nr:DUF2304 domain-containing protein [Ardenticatenaceae bacterium]HBY94777.1 hypothetical protein [Chloroflexota bacterium]